MKRSPFSLLHLAPTLLEAAGVQIPASFRGQSQWSRVRNGTEFDETAIAESIAGCTNPFRPESRLAPRVLAVRESRFKLIFDFNTERERLYDLDADPTEQLPLSLGSESGVRRRLLERAREHLRQSVAECDLAARAHSQMRDLRQSESLVGNKLQWPFPEARAS